MSKDINLVSRNAQPVVVSLKEAWPIGTLQEIRDAGLDVREYAACSPRDDSQKIPGCPVWDLCALNHLKGVAGPVNFGIQIVKPPSMGGGVREVAMQCFRAVDLRAKADESKSDMVVQIIAEEGEEGEEIRFVESEPNGPVTKDGPASYSDKVVSRTVEKFPRLRENPKFLKEALAGAVRKKYTDERRQADLDRRLAEAEVRPLVQSSAEKPAGKPERK